jgi:hypothetical protein
MIAALLLVLQSQSPTVGDTVWIERILSGTGRSIVRPQQWDLGAEGAQLGPATVSYGEGGITVRYPVVLWYPGDRSLTMPGPVLVYPDGTSDTLAASVHRIRVLSVLPADQAKSRLPPRPPRNPLPLSSRSLIPLILLLVGSALVVAIVAVRWRRRRTPVPRAEPVLAEPTPELLTQWASMGEYRAALHHWGWRLSRRLKRSQDLQEMAALQSTLEEIGDRTFIAEPPNRLAELAAKAARLEGSRR